MNLSEALEFAVDTWFSADHATALTYNGSSIYGHIIYGGTGTPMARHATLIVKVGDVAEPEYNDTVVIGSNTWKVFRGSGDVAVKGDGVTWELPIFRESKPKQL